MGGGPTSPGELRSVLTQTLFTLIVHARLPYYKQDTVDFATFGRNIFLEDHFGPIVADHVWPALIALSKIGLDHMPDLSLYLPAPTDPSYPTQCLGLQLLLDHCPRLLFRGVDQRWTYAYFSTVSQRLAAVWLALPDAARPDTWARWQAAGAGLDYWLCVRFWFGTPFVHSELLANQEIALAYTDETRSAVERASGKMDPYRARRDQILADLHGFPREYVRGPPQGEHVTRERWTWWVSMLMDIHKPIIDRFRRYPYLNSINGRASTGEEIEWLDEVGHFGEASKEVAERIREDVQAGRWTPLGTDSLGEHSCM
ncbi:hypothetical protein B0T22DRAFT_467481 [Podospora appendiculata]|uniref:Uncharacterized protein n=1 Tax=Podospora appendiculata TaxID=314037 RepID=A0AAE1CB48_9PEZI|nr:hypothetical protein B0T22DRAFT_467481 [Podospora appendiculata]